MKNRIRVVHGDITRLQVGAIVNAANATLMGGDGVDGAIHRAAGPALVEACKAIITRQGECAIGEALITEGGRLPAAWVIHTVGPVWHGGLAGESILLAKAYESCLRLAQQREISSVAFPAISTGVYGYPKAAAADIAVRSVTEFLQQHAMPQQVYLVCFEEESFMLHQQALTRWLQDQQPLTPTDLETD